MAGSWLEGVPQLRFFEGRGAGHRRCGASGRFGVLHRSARPPSLRAMDRAARRAHPRPGPRGGCDRRQGRPLPSLKARRCTRPRPRPPGRLPGRRARQGARGPLKHRARAGQPLRGSGAARPHMERGPSSGRPRRTPSGAGLRAPVLSGRHGLIPETSSASSASYAGTGYPMTADSSRGLRS